MDIFVSYSSKDIELTQRFCKILKNSGFFYWVAYENDDFGDSYATTIINQIADCKILLVIVTSSSNESIHVINEINAAVSRKKIIIPVVMPDVTLSPAMEYYISSSHYLIYSETEDFEKRFLHRMSDLLNGERSEIPQKNEPKVETHVKQKPESKDETEELIDSAANGNDDALVEICFRYVAAMVRNRISFDITKNKTAEGSVRKSLWDNLNNLRSGRIVFLTETVQLSNDEEILVDVDFSWTNAKYYMMLPLERADNDLKAHTIEKAIEAGDRYYGENKLVMSATQYINALSYDPYIVDVWIKLGEVYREMGVNLRAIHCYEKALKTDPCSGRAYSNMGAAFTCMKDYDRAKKCYIKAFSIWIKTAMIL